MEKILKHSNGDFTTVVNCIKKQASLIKNIRARHPNYNKLFVAVDFTAFGSQFKDVEGLNIINGSKCNKILINAITVCPKCNKVLIVIIICPKCNKLLSCQLQ